MARGKYRLCGGVSVNTIPHYHFMDDDEMDNILKYLNHQGWEQFKCKMMDRGVSGKSVTCKAVQTALGIIAESDADYRGALDGCVAAVKERERRLSDLIDRYEKLIDGISERERDIDRKAEELARREAELVKREEVQQDIESKITNNYETKGMRDRMRAAAFFKQEANPQNVYQQTAYINGLAAILTGQKETDEEAQS